MTDHGQCCATCTHWQRQKKVDSSQQWLGHCDVVVEFPASFIVTKVIMSEGSGSDCRFHQAKVPVLSGTRRNI